LDDEDCPIYVSFAYYFFCCGPPLDDQAAPLAESPFLVDLLRSVRDQVFAGDPDGRRLIESYYRFAPELVQRLVQDRQLAVDSYRTIRELQPAIEARLRGRPGAPGSSGLSSEAAEMIELF
jgi:hypothetical protein